MCERGCRGWRLCLRRPPLRHGGTGEVQYSAHIRQRVGMDFHGVRIPCHIGQQGVVAVFGPTRQYFDGLILLQKGSDDGLANQSRSTSDENGFLHAGQTTRGGFLLYLQTTSEHHAHSFLCFNASPHSNGFGILLVLSIHAPNGLESNAL